MTVKAIPDGYQQVIPYLTVRGVARLIEFLKQAFDGVEVYRGREENGVVSHAEVRIFGLVVMMGEASGDWQPRPGSIYLYVEDCDAIYHKAIAAGAKSLMEPANQFYGDRNGGIEDPSGNHWYIGTHIEDISNDELRRRENERAKT